MNIVNDRAGRELALVAAALSGAYPLAAALGGRAGNSVLIGCVGVPDLDLIAARVAADRSPAAVVTPAELSRRVAGTVALRDAEIAA